MVENIKDDIDFYFNTYAGGEEELNDDETDYEYVLQTDQTVEILESLGFNWPKPDADYLRRTMNYLKNLKFFN